MPMTETIVHGIERDTLKFVRKDLAIGGDRQFTVIVLQCENKHGDRFEFTMYTNARWEDDVSVDLGGLAIRTDDEGETDGT